MAIKKIVSRSIQDGAVVAADVGTLTTATITGGTINGTTVGGSTPAAGSFTTLNTSDAVVFNDAGADVDFRVEGDTDANLLFVDASTDRVGIGTDAPAVKLELSANDSVALRLTSTDTGATADDVLGSVEFYGSDASSAGAGVKSSIVATAQGTGGAASDLIFSTSPGATNNEERMRIDSSGNLLVAMTASSASAVGIRALSSGTFAATRDGGAAGVFNRLTSDGDIVEFRKDTTTVGAIGTTGGELYINFGGSIGGDVTSRTLDDYEEGTFTVTTNGDSTGAFTSQTGEYTKIGNVCVARIAFRVSSNFADTSIGGLPFTVTGNNSASAVVVVCPVMTSNANESPIIATANIGNTVVVFYSGTTTATAHTPNTTNLIYRMIFTYRTA